MTSDSPTGRRPPRHRLARSVVKLAAAAVATLLGTACGVDPPSAAVGIRVSGCDLTTETGSGVVVADGLVLTSAHTLRGARSVEVVRDGDDRPATIVGFDPEMDLAYLAIAPLPGGAMPVGSDHVADGDRGVAWVVRDGAVERLDVGVRRRVRINTEDIYVDGETTRPGFELDVDIRGGDSGGAVVVDGQVVGILWARSRRFPGRAYAIDPDRADDRIAEQLRTAQLGDDVDLSRCR